jgi:hypothetical protein
MLYCLKQRKLRFMNVISGVVRDSQGNPTAHARVYFTSGPVPLPDIAALTSKDGMFSLSAPVSGSYTLACVADGFAPIEVTAAVTDNKETQLDIRLRHK